MLDSDRNRGHADGAWSQKGLQVVVADVEAVRQTLTGRGVATTEVDKQPWGWFIYFSDPDGNTWSVQQIVPRA
jgi:uncharacterized glyoxalase superfamily protein PhnB